MNKNVQEKVGKLQVLEQNLQQLGQQKQQLQSSYFELESAEKELKKTSTVFKIIGNLMVAADKNTLAKDVASKKEILELKLNNVEKQEEKTREESQALQKEVMGAMKRE